MELDLAALNVETHKALSLALLGAEGEVTDRGVIATEDIPPHTVIASIPLNSTISAQGLLDNVDEFSALSTFANTSSRITDDDLIAIAIILSRKDTGAGCDNAYLQRFNGFCMNFPSTFDSTIFLR